MSAASSCDCFCPNPVITQVPGSPGEQGPPCEPCADGINAFTLTTSDIIIPAIGAPVGVFVEDSRWIGLLQTVFVTDNVHVGHFQVTAIFDQTTITLTFLGYAGDDAPAVTIGDGAKMSPGGVTAPLSAPLPTALTDNSTGTASNTIAAGAGVFTITIPLTSLATGLSTLAIDLLTNYIPGYAFKLLSFDFVTTIVGAGAGASQTFNLEIGTTNTTGGVLNVTLASTAGIGGVTSGTAITANNVGTVTDSLSIEMAAGGTVFSSGSGYFVIKLQNMDTANAIASLSDHVNDLITSLT
jgi:hypothetical protein